jgi:hypothetical protein
MAQGVDILRNHCQPLLTHREMCKLDGYAEARIGRALHEQEGSTL